MLSRLLQLTRILPPVSHRTNITYSGGQASVGQGGFYGSGGSRATAPQAVTHQEKAVAHTEDVTFMEEVVVLIHELEAKLEGEMSSNHNSVNGKTIEIKAKLKKTCTQPKVMEVLERLEFKGQPVWGLSVREREVVGFLREKCSSS